VAVESVYILLGSGGLNDGLKKKKLWFNWEMLVCSMDTAGSVLACPCEWEALGWWHGSPQVYCTTVPNGGAKGKKAEMPGRAVGR